MTQVMTPSEGITTGQIGKFQELLGAALRKSGLPSASVQQVLETQGGELVTNLVATLRTVVEAISKMFSRRVTVDLALSPQAVLDATGHTQYVDANVVAAMPRGQAEDELFFFKPRPEVYRNGLISDEALEQEFDFLNLKPASPYSLAKTNQDDPAFADTHPNGTHWKDADGRWCFAAFRRWNGKRNVYVRRDGNDWNDYWWFAGVRK